MLNRRDFLAGAGLVAMEMASRSLVAQGAKPGNERVITVDLKKSTGDLPRFWERAAGSDRTAVGLRAQWREDLVRAHRETGIQSVRCHGLFDDEMGIAQAGAGRFNFLYVDQIYDFMLDHGVRPFVELSFMPEAFASSENRIFAYKGNTSPPRNGQDWHDMVRAFTEHCVKRYGIGEVSQWRFEVWNEPNINFWAGTQEQYFELYRQSVLAVKSIDKRLLVGGPASAQLSWVPDLIRYCSAKNLPLDFISTHIYPSDPQKPIFGQGNLYPYEEVIPRGLEHVNQQIASSAMPNLSLWITEWSSQNPAFITHTVKSCLGLAETMSYWTFSNVFEENGVPSGVFNQTFGMLDQWGIARPSLHAFNFLHRLGDKQLQASEGPILATQRADGATALLLWNLIPLGKFKSSLAGLMASRDGGPPQGEPLMVQLQLNGLNGRRQVTVREVNRKVGTAIPAWEAMGKPQYPSREQISELRAAAELPKPVTHALAEGQHELVIELPPDGIVLLEFES